MPNGKLVFTNRGDAEGIEEPIDQAVRSVQRPISSPTKETLSALIRAQTPVRYAEDAPKVQNFNLRKEPSLGEMAPAARGQGGGGGFYQAEGTDRDRTVRRLEDAFAASALAGAEREEKLAKMDPRDRAALDNREIMTIAYLVNQFRPEIEKARTTMRGKVELARKNIADPKLRRAAFDEAEADMNREIGPLQNIVSILRGVRPSQ